MTKHTGRVPAAPAVLNDPLRNRGVAGKLAVYTAAAGVDPRRAIAVSLDVGTDNETLLNDPLYLGNRHARVRGAAYDAFIGTYLETVSALFPNALLHFEDFGPGNARLILTEYRDKYRNFNDDMQGTGAITLAALLAAVRWGAEQTGYPFTTAASKFAAQASLDAMVAAAAGPRGLAVPLMKIANDIRRLASGPRCGLVTWP